MRVSTEQITACNVLKRDDAEGRCDENEAQTHLEDASRNDADEQPAEDGAEDRTGALGRDREAAPLSVLIDTLARVAQHANLDRGEADGEALRSPVLMSAR